MIGRNEFDELREEVGRKAEFYPDQNINTPIIFTDSGYDGAFAVSTVSDTAVSVAAGFAVFGSGKLSIPVNSSFECDVSSDGTLYIYYKLTATSAGNITYELVSSKTFPTVTFEPEEVWSYPFVCAEATIENNIITTTVQQQYGHHHVSGVVS